MKRWAFIVLFRPTRLPVQWESTLKPPAMEMNRVNFFPLGKSCVHCIIITEVDENETLIGFGALQFKKRVISPVWAHLPCNFWDLGPLPPFWQTVCVPGWSIQTVEFPLSSLLLCGNSECLLLKFIFFLLYNSRGKLEDPPSRDMWATGMETYTPESKCWLSVLAEVMVTYHTQHLNIFYVWIDSLHVDSKFLSS